MGWLSSSKPKKPKPSAEEKALARNAAKDWNDYQQRFVPVENSFIAELTPDKGEVAQLRGRQAADIAQAQKGADASLVSASAAGGLGAGRSVMARHSQSLGGAKARSGAVTGADTALRNRKLAGMMKMAAFGRGLNDSRQVSSISAAGDATSRYVGDIRNDTFLRGERLGAIGTAAGTAMSSYTAFGGGGTKPAQTAQT